MKIEQYFKIGKDVLNFYLLKRNTPISCHFSLTNRCPLNCVYCGFFKRYRNEITTDQVKQIILELVKLGNIRLHFTGGEPLLREDIGEIVTFAKKQKIYVTIATSGYNLIKEWKGIRNSDLIFLSFDGPFEIHEKQKGKDSYRLFNDSKEYLSKQNKKFYTTTVVTKINKSYIDFIINEAIKYNFITNYFFLFIDTYSNDINQSMHRESISEDLYLTNDEKKEIIKYLIKIKKGKFGKYIGSSLSYLNYLFRWPDLNIIYSHKSIKYKCKAGKLFCYIDSNGDLYSCGEIMGQRKGVNLLKFPLELALTRLPAIPCYSCIVGCYVELNMLFGFNLDVLLNWIKKT